MSYITAIRVGGVALDMGKVLADVETSHGRAGAYDGPTASTARLTLFPATALDAKMLVVGAQLAIDRDPSTGTGQPWGSALFRGRITDSVIADDDPEVEAAVSVVAIGNLSLLGGVPVGAGDYPAEAWAARVNRVLNEAGVHPFTVVPPTGSDFTLAARTGEQTDALAMISELADTGGAAVYDDPGGGIIVQALGARPVGSVTIPPGIVVWAPEWSQHLDVVNRVTVPYEPDLAVILEDAVSRSHYGLAAADLSGGGFSTVTDAQRRGLAILVRRAWSRWGCERVQLTDPFEAAAVVGRLVTLSPLPDSAPRVSSSLVVEGVAVSVLRDHATMQLSLSDPVDSGAALAWNGVPADVAWNEAHGRWVDAISLESVIGGPATRD